MGKPRSWRFQCESTVLLMRVDDGGRGGHNRSRDSRNIRLGRASAEGENYVTKLARD